MRSIGLRAEPGSFNWAVLDGTLEIPILLANESVAAPNSYGEAEKLNFLRARLQLILDQYSPNAAGVRTPEAMARGANESARKRLRVEGVLLATTAAANIPCTTGALVTVTKLLGSKAKELLASSEYRGINWSDYTAGRREAILMGASLLR